MTNLSFAQLKKNAKKDSSNFKKHKLAIMGNCATQHIAKALQGYAYSENIGLDILDTDYNLIDAEIMDTSSEFYEFSPNSTLIVMCVEKLYEEFCELDNTMKSSFSESVYSRICEQWSMINQNTNTHILQFTFAENDSRIFGNYACKTPESFIYQIRKLNLMIMEGAQQIKNVYLVDINYIQSTYGRKNFYDDKMYYIAKMPFSTEMLPEIAKQVIDIIKSFMGLVKKCVILDLDNTIWGGVIGDDGLNGIQIGELGVGHAFSEFQMWLKELKKRGIVLAVCSKNNEDTAKEPFEKHPEMILKLSDISMFVANWEDKASNIQKIQQTLNIGMDSIVFFDDNPFERNLVKSMIPEITVPELPEDPALYLTYIKSLNLFETASYSEADKDRTKQYQAEINRQGLQKKFETFDDYLKSLEMVAQAKPFDSFYYPRIAQLTQRSNQFNLRTIRYTEAEIEQVANNKDNFTIYYTLKDKFGDHGLISVVILDKIDDETLFISTWLMSCRVLKRGMEEFIINKIIEVARANGYKSVIGEYIKTPKNSMVEHIYEKMNFDFIGDNKYIVDVNAYALNKTNIKEK